MHFSKATIMNFRLIKNACLCFDEYERKKLSLLIGRNNTGKTSFIVLFNKFLSSSSPRFDYHDFPISIRESILNIDADTDVTQLSIKLIVEIAYDENDSLENLSDLILDLDPTVKTVNVCFECVIDQKKLLKSLSLIKKNKKGYIKKNINKYLKSSIYTLSNIEDLENKHRRELVKAEWTSIDKLINFQFINAKREVASSESNSNSKKVLSSLTTQYFNKCNKFSHDELDAINSSIIEMDDKLDSTYIDYFKDFLKNAKEFLNIDDLKVISDLQSKEILSGQSRIVYGDSESQLPEHLNGLGYLNILFLLLNIEIIKSIFIETPKEINLLFIEEPEAHTHPQMQYVFIEKIHDLISEIPKIQALITTHSAHIVNKCDFKDLRYLLKNDDPVNVEIKDFHKDLTEKYKHDDKEKDVEEKSFFKFLKQYLSLNSSELFFAEKIIFIEGISEQLLLPYFMQQIDQKNKDEVDYIPLSSQNISILEVGANAKAFRHFLEFLGIKTLIITDIDTTKLVEEKKKTYSATPVVEGTHTSNYTLKYYLNAPPYEDEEGFSEWMESLKQDSLQPSESITKISYQTKEKDYHARSFEDAFIYSNIETIIKNLHRIEGLKNTKNFEDLSDFYTLTDTVIKSKSNFASSLLWLALSDDVSWNIPLYIENGLEWIAKK